MKYEELQSDVSAYLELLHAHLAAADAGDLHKALAMGKRMRQLREKHDPKKWTCELHRQDTANDF